MNTEEAIKANIYAQLNDMSKLDELCGRTSMLLATTLGVLLNNDADLHITELKKVCNEMFKEAEKAQKIQRNVQ
jgi:hypothetical protein